MSTRSEKKSTRLLYDRSGTRYWCIQTESTSIETNEFTIHKKEVENNSGNSIEEMPLESCLSELKNILESSTEFMEKRSAKIDAQIRITPNKIITETFSSPLNPKGEKSFTISEKQFGNVREWSSDDELEEELSIFKAIKERMTSEATEVKKNKEKKAEEMDISEENSIWRAKGMREERALAIGHWRTLPLKLQKKILKIDGDCKYFFTTHVKNKMKSTKGGPLNLKYHNCTCIECDPKRAFMQVQFEAFYTRYRVAQSLESSSRADKLEISSDKIFKEAAETKFFDGSVEDLKKKIYNIALQMIKDSGELYIEISKKLLYDQQKIMATYADEVNSISLAKSEGLSNERLRDGKLHFCVEHSKEKHQLDFPHYKIEKSSGRPVPCIENCDHTPLTSLAANMALAADMLGLSKQNGGSPRLLTHADDSNKKEKIPEDRAPFPAANPPEGMTSSWTRCGDKECYFNKPVIANSRNPDSKDEIGEEKIKIALKTSLDDETLMQIYVTKLFDHRIVNYYREMLVQRRQEKLIEEIELEEKSKSNASSKKGKKKAAKNIKKFEEELARKQREAEAEKEEEERRQAEAQEELRRQQKLEEELEAEIQRAREKNSRIEAEKIKKAPKAEQIKSTKKSTKSTESKKQEPLVTTPKKKFIESIPINTKLTKQKNVEPKEKIGSLSDTLNQHLKNKSSTTPISVNKTEVNPVKKQGRAKSDDSRTINTNEMKVDSHSNIKKNIQLNSIKSPTVSQLKSSRTEAWKPIPSCTPVTLSKSTIVDAKSLSDFPELSSDKRSPVEIGNVDEKDQMNPYFQPFIEPLLDLNENNPIGGLNTQNTPFMGPPGIAPIPNYTMQYPYQPGLGGSNYTSSTYNGFNKPSYSSMYSIPTNPMLDPYWNYGGYGTNHAPYPNFNMNGYTRPWAPEKSFLNPSLSQSNNMSRELESPPIGSNEGAVFHDSLPPIDNRGGVSNHFIQQTQEHARHAYFSLLIDMGLGLSTPLQNRPYVPLSQLYQKYKSLFVDGISSIGAFYQLCTFATSELDQSTNNTGGLSIPSNNFQFQPDIGQSYPQIRVSSLTTSFTGPESSSYKPSFYSHYHLGNKNPMEINGAKKYLGINSNEMDHLIGHSNNSLNSTSNTYETRPKLNFSSKELPLNSFDFNPFNKQNDGEFPSINPDFLAES